MTHYCYHTENRTFTHRHECDCTTRTAAQIVKFGMNHWADDDDTACEKAGIDDA